MSSLDQQPTSRLNSDDFLFNLTLLNALAFAVADALYGATIGRAFFAGLGVVLLGMPLILSLTYLVCRLEHKEHLYVGVTNVILLLTLLAAIALSVATLV